MAHILLVDSSALAQRALQGILARGGHRLAVATTARDALQLIGRNPAIDLIITELNLPEEDAFDLIHQLKANRVLRFLPVLIYAQRADRTQVKRALDLRVQNFRMKPFVDDEVFAEIEKCVVNPWRARHFEEERSFCRLTGLTPDQVHALLGTLSVTLRELRAGVAAGLEQRDAGLVQAQVGPVLEQAETAGAWCAVEVLNELLEHTTAQRWGAAELVLGTLDYVARLVDFWLDPSQLSPDFIPADDAAAQRLHVECQRWLAAPAAGLCPVETPARLLQEVAALRGFPVIESAVASFQMLVNGQKSSIGPVMDLVARDPGLTVEMLVCANRVHPPRDEFSRIEDARLAVSQLGETHLHSEASQLIAVPATTFDLGPAFHWVSYWTFQRGVARLAQLICRDLEFRSLEPVARTAAQMHDCGLLLLAHLRPAGCQAILTHARLNGQPLQRSEQLFLGCTTTALAAHFASTHGLSRRLVNLLRWRDQPGDATEDRQLIAIVSLARALCRHNEVGSCGEPPEENPRPLEETPEWEILREGLYPSFNLRQFELRVHAYCSQLRTELSGRETGTISDVIAHAAG